MSNTGKIAFTVRIGEKEPGLREETLLEMKRKRHAYGHEVVSLVDEVITLRRKLNMETSDAELTRPERLERAALLIDTCMCWSDTPQGQDFWSSAHVSLQENARRLRANPGAF